MGYTYHDIHGYILQLWPLEIGAQGGVQAGMPIQVSLFETLRSDELQSSTDTLRILAWETAHPQWLVLHAIQHAHGVSSRVHHLTVLYLPSCQQAGVGHRHTALHTAYTVTAPHPLPCSLACRVSHPRSAAASLHLALNTGDGCKMLTLTPPGLQPPEAPHPQSAATTPVLSTLPCIWKATAPGQSSLPWTHRPQGWLDSQTEHTAPRSGAAAAADKVGIASDISMDHEALLQHLLPPGHQLHRYDCRIVDTRLEPTQGPCGSPPHSAHAPPTHRVLLVCAVEATLLTGTFLGQQAMEEQGEGGSGGATRDERGNEVRWSPPAPPVHRESSRQAVARGMCETALKAQHPMSAICGTGHFAPLLHQAPLLSPSRMLHTAHQRYATQSLAGALRTRRAQRRQLQPRGDAAFTWRGGGFAGKRALGTPPRQRLIAGGFTSSASAASSACSLDSLELLQGRFHSPAAAAAVRTSPKVGRRIKGWGRRGGVCRARTESLHTNFSGLFCLSRPGHQQAGRGNGRSYGPRHELAHQGEGGQGGILGTGASQRFVFLLHLDPHARRTDVLRVAQLPSGNSTPAAAAAATGGGGATQVRSLAHVTAAWVNRVRGTCLPPRHIGGLTTQSSNDGFLRGVSLKALHHPILPMAILA